MANSGNQPQQPVRLSPAVIEQLGLLPQKVLTAVRPLLRDQDYREERQGASGFAITITSPSAIVGSVTLEVLDTSITFRRLEDMLYGYGPVESEGSSPPGKPTPTLVTTIILQSILDDQFWIRVPGSDELPEIAPPRPTEVRRFGPIAFLWSGTPVIEVVPPLMRTYNRDELAAGLALVVPRATAESLATAWFVDEELDSNGYRLFDFNYFEPEVPAGIAVQGGTNGSTPIRVEPSYSDYSGWSEQKKIEWLDEVRWMHFRLAALVSDQVLARLRVAERLTPEQAESWRASTRRMVEALGR